MQIGPRPDTESPNLEVNRFKLEQSRSYLHYSRLHSTTSTLSAGSTGSQARLIQSSHQPENYHPMQVEELGKPSSPNTKTVKAEVHITKSKSPNRSPKKRSSLSKKDCSPNNSRKSSPSSRKSSPSPKAPKKLEASSSKENESDSKSPKKIKSSLKQPSKSLSIENPTCVECYLSGKTDTNKR